MDRYDYIVAGAGAAGLSLLVHMIRSGRLNDKNILLVDRGPKTQNDRTWCFWEKEPGPFEEVVYRQWRQLSFHDAEGSMVADIDPYRYKLIRGADFYRYCFDLIGRQPNVTVRYGEVTDCISNGSSTYVILDGKRIDAGYILNSIPFGDPAPKARHFLLQHFKGWVIETDSALFDESCATLMDFRTPQIGGDTSFVYVMPFSEKRALVEFTMFSKNVLAPVAYDEALRNYLESISARTYRIMEEEIGVIPMTDFPFTRRSNNLIAIGSAGGQTKPSTGYTFRFIQKHSAALVESLITTGKPFFREKLADRRFRVYDSVLLDVLSHRSVAGEKIFSTLMRSNGLPRVLKFLDNETSLVEEMKIIRRLPTLVFLRALLRCLG